MVCGSKMGARFSGRVRKCRWLKYGTRTARAILGKIAQQPQREEVFPKFEGRRRILGCLLASPSAAPTSGLADIDEMTVENVSGKLRIDLG
jgi:hypothetical protein